MDYKVVFWQWQWYFPLAYSCTSTLFTWFVTTRISGLPMAKVYRIQILNDILSFNFSRRTNHPFSPRCIFVRNDCKLKCLKGRSVEYRVPCHYCFWWTLSRLSTYRPIPRCHITRGTNKTRPKMNVHHNIGLYLLNSHLCSPKAHKVTHRCKTSAKTSGVSSAPTIFSCKAGCVCKCLRAAVRTKMFTMPKRPQTCASCSIVTSVALGSGPEGVVSSGHGACWLWAVSGS